MILKTIVLYYFEYCCYTLYYLSKTSEKNNILLLDYLLEGKLKGFQNFKKEKKTFSTLTLIVNAILISSLISYANLCQKRITQTA